jgi:ribosome-binding protein aMBF1 (putative translation factor)
MHQDWKTIVLSKPKIQPKEIVKKPSSLPSGFKLDENDEIKSIKYVSKDISQLIINARCAKKMSRKDLAKNMNLKEDIITNIETGKAIYNGDQIARIKKFLGI